MPSSVSESSAQSAHVPRWIRAADILCLLLVGVAAIVAVSGGFRERLDGTGWRIAVTSPYPLLLWALAIGIVRHVAAPAMPIYRDLPDRLAAWWREPAVRTATIAVVGTRPAILFVGYIAVFMFGFGFKGPGQPLRGFDNELLNLPIRFDAGWYLRIAIEGYSFAPSNPNKPPEQQTIAFFPAYPMVVRGLGRLLGGLLAAYVVAGMLVSLGAFLAALVYVYRLARDTLSDDGARYAVWLLAAYPFALFFGVIYVESLLLLGMTGTFFHFGKEQFGRAALWGLLVGLTKTNGCVVSVPLAILALENWYGTHGRDRARKEPYPIVTAMLAAAAPGIGMLMFAAFTWHLTGDPLAWLKAHLAWGREYRGFVSLVTDRYNIIAHAGVQGYVSSLPHDLLNALGVVFVLATVWPVARRLGLAYAVLILIYILPPIAAGGLISAGRFSSVLFPAFIWMAGAVPSHHRIGWIASFAAIQAFNATLFYTWRPLY